MFALTDDIKVEEMRPYSLGEGEKDCGSLLGASIRSKALRCTARMMVRSPQELFNRCNASL
jgi:hypothetical protein